MIKAKIEGTKTVVRNLKRYAKEIDDALAKSLYQEGESIMSSSKKECPVKHGVLRNTGRVRLGKSKGEYQATLTYGTNYGIFVHERTGVRHPVGKDHFLRDPFNAAMSGFKSRLAKRIRAFMRGL